MSSPPFDRVRLRRTRFHPRFDEADFLFRESAAQLAERAADFNRSYGLAAEIGAARGGLASIIKADQWVTLDLALCSSVAVVADEEALPLKQGGFDLIVSNLALHQVNDLPGVLIQIRRALKPDGLFLAAMLGGSTLVELRQVLLEAEEAVTGRVFPRIAPMVDVRDLGTLMQRAGFALPVTDIDPITVSYSRPSGLLQDLKAMGEANPLKKRAPLRRDVLAMALARYEEQFPAEDSSVHATFEIVFMTGFAPAPDQPQPLKPGSATTRLADALGTQEHKTGKS